MAAGNDMDAAGDESSRPRLSRRSWADWVSEHPKTVAAVLVLVLLVAAWFLIDAAGRARLARARAAIIARGEPLTVDDLRKRMPVLPDERNMAIGLLEHGGAIHAAPESQPADPVLDAIPIYGNAIAPPVGVRYPERQLAAGRRLVAANAEQIAGIGRATELEAGVYPIAWRKLGAMPVLPPLRTHRAVVTTLALAATVAAHDGRADESMTQLARAAATDRTIRNDPFYISMLTRIGCESLTCTTMLRCVAQTPFNDAQLEKLNRLIASFSAGPGLRNALLAERALAMDAIARAYGGGNIASVTGIAGPPALVIKLVPGIRGADPAIFLEQMGRLCMAASLPAAKAVVEADVVERNISNLPFYAILSKIKTPSLTRGVALWYRTQSILRATRSALAAERYRLRHGVWPGELGALVPEFLPAEAIDDPFSGKTLVYHRDPDGIRIYSVCEDGVDDGGLIDRLRSTTQRTMFDPGGCSAKSGTAESPAEHASDGGVMQCVRGHPRDASAGEGAGRYDGPGMLAATVGD